jgi:D-glycero-alpha-D-manno-heptose-7-phosphate kinase
MPGYFKKNGGACLTTTIDKYIYCIVKKRFDDKIYINYSVKEKVDNVDKIKHDIVREAMKMVGVEKGVEITFLSDVPSEGSGLGSSSAVAVGVLNALHNYIGESVPAYQLAWEACRIEVDILGKPIGYQDQYAVAFGGFNLLEFNSERFEVTQLDPEDLDDYLMLIYTGITRSADKVLSKMRLNKKILDTIKLETTKKLDHITDPVILGDLLDRYWALKVRLNKEVTNPKINKMYKRALLYGAYGGKIVGAGAGGFLLLAVPKEDQDVIRHEFEEYKELPFRFSKYGSRVIFNINE